MSPNPSFIRWVQIWTAGLLLVMFAACKDNSGGGNPGPPAPVAGADAGGLGGTPASGSLCATQTASSCLAPSCSLNQTTGHCEASSTAGATCTTNINQGSCSAVAGCLWDAVSMLCSGTPQAVGATASCSSYPQTTCGNVAGCTWSPSLGTCAGIASAPATGAVACPAMTVQASCAVTPGCTWSPTTMNCEAAVTATSSCATYDMNSCGSVAGCAWQASLNMCAAGSSAPVVGCATTNALACGSTPGCLWNALLSSCSASTLGMQSGTSDSCTTNNFFICPFVGCHWDLFGGKCVH